MGRKANLCITELEKNTIYLNSINKSLTYKVILIRLRGSIKFDSRSIRSTSLAPQSCVSRWARRVQ